ncbi:putative splicing factor, arginine/serine-rich 7 [Halotydeus destructor]|nr:putative splicing factor, arginine/serine-rich 7 [Halotydeus destructor]
MALEESSVIQVTNIAPAATLEQMTTLFSFMGELKDIQLYPTEAGGTNVSQICYVKYLDSVSALVAQHLTNTVFIDRALVVLPHTEDKIPDATTAQSSVSSSGASGGSNTGLISQVVPGIGGTQVITTIDPRLAALGLPQYPPLPANMDPSKVEEIRRTVYVGNLDSSCTAEQLLKFFNQIGEVKFVRMAGDDTQPTRFAFVEFTDQSSVANALQYNGAIFVGRSLKINHSNNAIVKPQTKTTEAAQKEIEEAMKRVREAQSLISAAIEPLMKADGSETTKKEEEAISTIASKRSRTKSPERSRDRRERTKSPRRRSRSRERRLSHSRDRSRRGIRSRSREPRRSRSREPRRPERVRSRERFRRSKSRERRRRKSPSRERRRSPPERVRDRDRDRERDRRRRHASRDREARKKSPVRADDYRRERSARERSPVRDRDRDRRSKEKSPSLSAEGPALPPSAEKRSRSSVKESPIKAKPEPRTPPSEHSIEMELDDRSSPYIKPALPAGPSTPPSREKSMSMSPPPSPVVVRPSLPVDELPISMRSSRVDEIPEQPRRSRSRERARRSTSRSRERHKRRKDKDRARSQSKERDRVKKSKKSKRDREAKKEGSKSKLIRRDYDAEERAYDSDQRPITPS